MSSRYHLRPNRASRALLTVLGCTLLSCSSKPARVAQPSINPSSAGKQAMAMYDTNGDGIVAGDELESAPGLKAALPTMDTNGDGGISAEEVAARVRQWKAMGVGVTSFSFRVTLDGKPLDGALVTFVPEVFLGGEIQAASCLTNMTGSGVATIPKEQRPNSNSPPGMHIGLYQVKISKPVNGSETIPRKYNEETVLGQEVGFDVREVINNRVAYALSTK